MTILGIDHSAIAVHNLDEAIARYHRLVGGELESRAAVPQQEVEVAFLRYGESQLELISPTTSDSGVARFLARRGEGLHHVAMLVDDIRAELDRLRGLNVRLIDQQPREGAHGLVAFVHPEALGGVLLELVQK